MLLFIKRHEKFKNLKNEFLCLLLILTAAASEAFPVGAHLRYADHFILLQWCFVGLTISNVKNLYSKKLNEQSNK